MAVSVAYVPPPDFTDYNPHMPLIWTDTDGFVNRVHYKPSLVEEEDSNNSEYVSNIPSPPSEMSEVEARESMYYSDDLGIHYK